MKIIPLGVELFRSDGQTDRQAGRQAGRQTDMAKLMVAFRNFANASTNTYTFRLMHADNKKGMIHHQISLI